MEPPLGRLHFAASWSAVFVMREMRTIILALASGAALLAAVGVTQPASAQPESGSLPVQADSEQLSVIARPEPATASNRNTPAAKPKPRASRSHYAAAPAATPSAQPLFGFNLFRFLGISMVPRTTVAFAGNYKPGTIVVHTEERRLYYVLGGGEAIRYGIGVGREGFTWRGVRTVTDKREWPAWTPPPQMLRRQPNLPRHMAGGRDNPLGARALYLGDSLYRIHGTNETDTIGTAASSGCIRLTNDDVIDLYERVRLGATVVVR
jgi:lipoprotein-anchoring transpeptidase ErfK/SrfK